MSTPLPAGARLAFATHNAHKVDEVWAILSPHVPQLTREQFVDAAVLGTTAPVEDGTTFEANALIKARALCTATGVPALADDSGIAVDVLGGAPGVFSARWSGNHGDDRANLRLLLDQLAEVRDEDRSAEFVCAAALVTPAGHEYVEVGRMHGQLVREPAGDGGFGYDPIFVASGQSVTNAALAPADKNAISHRGAAFRALAPRVAVELDGS